MDDAQSVPAESIFDVCAILDGHQGHVTSLAVSPTDPSVLLSASRDKSLLLWDVRRDGHDFAVPKKRFLKHTHIVSDVVVTKDGAHAITGGWDSNIWVWDISGDNPGAEALDCLRGHTDDVLSVSVCPVTHAIVSGSRDRTIRVWHASGECKHTFTAPHGHSDWVSCVQAAPPDGTSTNSLFLSCGYDCAVKHWSLHDREVTVSNLMGHTGYVYALAVAPDASLSASGGHDKTILLWDNKEISCVFTLLTKDVVHALVFSPVRYWVCAAVSSGIQVWDLRSQRLMVTLRPDLPKLSDKALVPYCKSLAWSADGTTLYAGYTDSKVRVWTLSTTTSGVDADELLEE